MALLLVSHSRDLAEATARLARQMTGESVTLACVAGAGEDGGELGTDAVRVAEALLALDRPAGVLMLMDLGSAILSAQTALDLVDPEVKRRARLVAAPFVEGATAAAVAAASGAPLEAVAREAALALEAKRAQIGGEDGALLAATSAAGPEHCGEAVIGDAHGLHARPAARLAIAAARFAAELTVSDLDSGRGPVAARSLVGLGSLGASAGHRLRIRGRGADAETAVRTLVELIGSFAGGTRDVTAPDAPKQDARRAIPVSPGVATGPLFDLGLAVPAISDAPAADPAAEVARLRSAVAAVRENLARAGAGRGGQTDILAVQDVFLNDPEVIGAAETMIGAQRRNAADAFARAGEAAASVFAGLADPVLRAREADLRDAVAAVLRRLLGVARPEPPQGEPAVLVVSDLPPSLANQLDSKKVLGVIDRRGGATSHAAILLRGLGIPAIAGAAALLPEPMPDRVAFDGATGELLLAPTPDQEAVFAARRNTAVAPPRVVTDGVLTLADGRRIEVWANVVGERDARAAREAGAFGIGVLRTEIMFLDRPDPPSEAEQAARLRPIFAAFGGRPIVVRTLDAGGDKPIPYMRLAREDNPYLGVRGLRLSLREPAIFETQLRAILTAGHGHCVWIMLPMVTELEEVAAARAMLEQAREALVAAGTPHVWPTPLGIMVEVPAAALEARALAEAADFFSIGTNDLTQYTLAAERGHPGLARFASASHPAVLRLVGEVAKVGAAAGRHVMVCGEAASDPAVAPLLVAAGVRALSLSARLFPAVAEALRRDGSG